MLKRNRFALLTDEELKDLLHGLHVTQNKSVLQMSKELGISRDAVYKWCAALGIPTRSGSEANRSRFSRASEEERKAVTHKANTARRGSKQTAEERENVARGKQATAKMSKYEVLFARWMLEAGLSGFVFNYAFGPYNIDFAFPSHQIAIEVDGGNWHTAPRKVEQDNAKTSALLTHSWRIYRLDTRGDFKNKSIGFIEGLVEELLGPSYTPSE